MKMSRQRVMLLVMCIAGLASPVLAADSSLTLVVAGEGFDGPPQFEVSFDGKPIGQGTVAAALDTTGGGHLAAVTDRTAYVQSFTFAVPETAFRSDGSVTVKFLNGADGTIAGSRALYLSTLLVNGRAVTASGMRLEGGSVPTPPTLSGEFLELAHTGAVAITTAPVGGWPQPSAVDPIATGAITAASAPLPAPATTPVAAGDDSCDGRTVYNVMGFNPNSNALTDGVVVRLDQVVKDIGARKCRLTVTGYASRQGGLEANALFAVERAQNVLRYLREHGVTVVAASATGGGATDRFGTSDRANRRVVITLSP